MTKGVGLDDGHGWDGGEIGLRSMGAEGGRRFLVDETRKRRRRRWGGWFWCAQAHRRYGAFNVALLDY